MTADAHRRDAQRDKDLRILALPVEPYLGLTLRAAQQRARSEGRDLMVTDMSRGRSALAPRRIKVEVDESGRIQRAAAG
jgi:hypothetical protein